MLTVLLGLSGALVYGFADFLGGLASRRFRAVTVAAVAAAVGIVPLLIGLAVVGGAFTTTTVLWGAVAGASGAVGVLLLYRALAIGPMSVLSPVTAVFAAVVPVLVAVVSGTALSGPAIAALLVAVVAVVLVAVSPDTSGARLTPDGLVTAAVAGCGFGGIVLAYDMTASGSGVASLLVARVLQVLLLGIAAVVVGVRGRPGGTADPVTSVDAAGSPAPPERPGRRPARARPGRRPARVWPGRRPARLWPGRRPARAWPGRRPARVVLTVVACGVLDAMANVCIQAALHSSDDPTTLPVVSVLTALYPIGTVALAGVVLGERLRAVQWVGIALASAAAAGLALT